MILAVQLVLLVLQYLVHLVVRLITFTIHNAYHPVRVLTGQEIQIGHVSNVTVVAISASLQEHRHPAHLAK